MNPIRSIQGMSDLLPPESARWQAVESCARGHFHSFNYSEIRTPLLEFTELFVRGIGTDTGVVQKEMYTFDDKGGDSVTLRPEGTASVVRAYIQHNLAHADAITKLYYLGPMFRYERPQKGRLRQFHQLGCELLGTKSALADVEVISLLDGLIRKVGVTDFTLEINSLGCMDSESCRPAYLKQVTAFFTDKAAGLCAECNRRLTTNPLRILDCKNPTCKEVAATAPVMLEFLCADCGPHFETVKQGLETLGVSFVVNERIVRGLDYYDKTAFEVLSNNLGSQNAFAGGGRYNKLVESMGGPATPAVGFAIGLERLLMLVPEKFGSAASRKIYLAPLGAKAHPVALKIARDIRAKNLVCEMELDDKSLKSQLRRADKLQCTHVVIVGDSEIEKGVAVVKDFAAKTQSEVPLGQVPDFLAGV